MAIANGAIYPIVVAQALRPFPQATGRAAALQNTLQLGLCFWQALSFLVDCYPLLTTTSVMLTTVLLAAVGYKMQSQKTDARKQMTARKLPTESLTNNCRGQLISPLRIIS